MNGHASTAVLLCFGLALQFAFLVTGLTTDPPTMNGGTVVLPRVANAANVSVFCRVTFMGVPRSTVWFITRLNGQREELTLNPPSDPNFVLRNSAVDSNLTIVSFSSDLDMVTLECTNNVEAPNREEAFFNLRIIGPPVLNSVSTAEISVENSPFSFTSIVQTPGYPDPPLYQWFYNEEPINTTTSTNPNVSVYPNIVFSSVVRTQSGNYSIRASTEGGDSTGYFILDVHYPVAADVSGTQMYYGVEGGSVTLVVHVNITGNPVPGSVWMVTGATARGDAVVSGQLTITNLTSADSGNYTNTLNNTLIDNSTSSVSNSALLQVLSPPSEPTNLNVTDIGSDTVNLSWTNPSSVGLPSFSFVIIKSVPSADPSSVITHNITVTKTNPLANNTVTVDRLQPNTSYSVSISAGSFHFAVGELRGPQSSPVPFRTNLGEPEFDFVRLENVGGKLNVTWSFKHTGGVPLLSVVVVCSSVEEGSGDDLTMNCGSNSMCGDGGDGSMVLLPTGSGNVTAGMNYSCTVTATNKFASVKRDTEYVLASSGVPSEPRINGVTAGVNMFTLTVQLYAGHSSSVYFDVVVVDVPNNKMMSRVENLQPEESISSNLMEYTITVPFSQRGHRHFIVTARNAFGSSMESEMYPSMGMIGVEVLQPTSTPTIPVATPSGPVGSVTPVTTGTTQPTDAASVNAGVVVGAVVAVVAIVLIILIVLLIVGFLIWRNKGDSYKVENKKRVVVEELDVDIGTELKTTPSGGDGPPDEPAPPAPTAVYSTVGESAASEPRAELHYADLQDFKKVDRPSKPVVKPQPIEEVQYAVINTQSLKKAPPPEPKPQEDEDDPEKAQTSTTFI